MVTAPEIYFTLNFPIREFGKMTLLYNTNTTIRVHKNGPTSSSGTLTLLELDLELDLRWRPEPFPWSSDVPNGPRDRRAPLGWHSTA